MGKPQAPPVRFRLDQMLGEFTQTELSRASGVSMTTINAMTLNKTKQVSLKTVAAICAALECEPGELFYIEKKGKR